MRLSTVILPVYRWREGQEVWRRAEELGLYAAYTYDHLSWQTFRGKPWFGTVPTLAAAATATSRIRLGTMVASPNFRHPVPFAKELMTLDDLSDGRITLGIGSGGEGFDATVLGEARWSKRERADRFGEFTRLLDVLLRQDETTALDGDHYRADGAQMLPGSTQRPRLPIHVAAAGPRGMRLAAEVGQGWITVGDLENGPKVATEQIARLREICAEAGRDLSTFELSLLNMPRSAPERPLASFDAFVDWAGRYREAGITELILHWPVADSEFAADMDLFERVAVEGLAAC
jgi:alkanesulfonate monooxygenase SsuD/methylene tetrahydromethanopterin reductase-like flavin-dependent oxidoreductase (luciferase family)